MTSSDPDLSRLRLIREGSLTESDWEEVSRCRGQHNRLGFAYQIAFVRILGRFPTQVPFEIDGEILRFTALQLKVSPEIMDAYSSRQQTVSEHQLRIRDYLHLQSFDSEAEERLVQFLEQEALRIDRTASLLARSREISRIALRKDFPFDPSLIQYISPIEWKNVILYGEIKIDPKKIKPRNP